MGKRKPPTIAQEVEKAAKLMQRLVRLKASDDLGYCTMFINIREIFVLKKLSASLVGTYM